jgi:flagellar motility protein MotE (MotC chaperone)
MPRFKLLPTTMVAALCFMSVKVVDIVRGGESLSNQLLIADVQAEASPEESKKIPAKDTAADEHGGEAKQGGAHEEAATDEDGEPSPVSDTPGETIDDHLSAVQIELLQKLAERRDELNRWESDIQLKETVLNATEKRINEKIAQIEAMKDEVNTMLVQYTDREDAKIRSLVKIYENMKPKDAARIFDEVDMPVLLLVIDKMSERKVAPILAGMDPKKAKELTVELAEQRKVDDAKLNNMPMPQAKAPARGAAQ